MLVPLTVSEVMIRDVETIAPDVTVAEAADRLVGANVGSLVVCDDGRPVGIVTESDLVRLLSEGKDGTETLVHEIASADLQTVTPDTTLEAAAERLEAGDFRRLPVCDGGEIVGIVTTTDLSYYLPRLSRRRRTGSLTDRPPATPSTAYDDPDWEFDRLGEGAVDVGETIRFRKRLSEADVERFAEATGDTNRLHLDEAFAAESRFGGRIAHGILGVGVISAALARLPGLVVYLSQDIRFLGPVRIDETVTAVCEVIDRLGENRFELTTTVYDEDGEVVIDGTAIVLVDALPGEAPPEQTKQRAVETATQEE